MQTMRLKLRQTGEEKVLEVGSASEKRPGGSGIYVVTDPTGNALGEFGPDEYESITFLSHQ